MNNIWNIHFIPPCEGNIDTDNYLQSIKDIIQKERESDPTIVLHTDDEILSKYASSVIAISDGKILWNSSIYPTKMHPLSDLMLDEKKIRVGESWSVIIHPDFRWLWLGKKITNKTLELFANEYDIIVGATVNNIMFVLRMQQGFERIPFPKSLYEEGKKYLAPFMKWGEQEFQERARCMMYNMKLTEKEKNDVINILQKEYRDESM